MSGPQQTVIAFDLAQGERLKEEGLALAQTEREELIDAARFAAAHIAANKGTVTIDEVHQYLLLHGYDPSLLGNAAGSIFRDREVFEFTGEWRKSARISNHARCNRVWRLREGHIREQ